jgi:hypothetical protein
LPADQKKIEELRAKRERGEALTQEDRAFIQRMMTMRANPGAEQKGVPKQAQSGARRAEREVVRSPSNFRGRLSVSILAP